MIAVKDIGEMEAAVTALLHDMGIPAHVKGYHYLRSAAVMTASDPGLTGAVTKEIYPAIASADNSTPESVERAMRYAVNAAWKNGNRDVMCFLMGAGSYEDMKKPTNSQFIAAVADRARVGSQ